MANTDSKAVKHIKVLGRKASPDTLFNASHLGKCVEELVQSLGMQLLGEVVVRDVELDLNKLGKEPFEDEGGMTVQAGGVRVAYGTLSTSHIAIHTWPLRGEYVMDIYSCREFSIEDVSQVIEEWLLGEKQITDLSYSLEWLEESPNREDPTVQTKLGGPTF